MNFDDLYGNLYFERNEDDIPDNENEDENENKDDIPDIPEGFSQDRPWFGKSQIRKAEELKFGMIVMSYCAIEAVVPSITE